jgi:hypothetical protein
MSGVYNTSNIILGHPKKPMTTKPLIARRPDISPIITADWNKVSRGFYIIKKQTKGKNNNRFMW